MKMDSQALLSRLEDFSHTVVVGVRSDTPVHETYAVKEMTLEGFMYVLEYGIQQALCDKCGGKTPDEIREIAGKLKSMLYTGVSIKRKNAAAPSVDTFTNIARKMVLARLGKDMRKKLAEMPDKGVKTLDELFAKNEAALRPIVEEKLEQMKREAEMAEGLDLTF